MVPLSGGSAGKVLHGDGTWKDTAAATNQWSITGNTGTTSATNFIGTTDNKSFKIKANNAQGFILDSLGSVGIGASPTFTSGTYREKFLVDAGSTSSNTIDRCYRGTITAFSNSIFKIQINGNAASHRPYNQC